MDKFIKGKLKAARDAIGKKDYQAAQDAANQVLSFEANNYTANVFLGLALLESKEYEKSEQAYNQAIQASPEQVLAWQGLCKFYERTERWTDYAKTLQHLCKLFAEAGDATKCGETIQKLIEHTRTRGTSTELVSVLRLLLPASPLYATLSNLPPPDPTAPLSTTTYDVQAAVHNSYPILSEIVALVEKEEEDTLKKELNKRRMRLNAGRPQEVQLEVDREILGASTLPSLYDEILNDPHTPDDVRRSTEGKLLRHKQRHLVALKPGTESAELKKKLRSEVQDMVHGMVLLDIPDELAWTMYIEAIDATEMKDYGLDTLQRFQQTFPTSPLTKLLQAYFAFAKIKFEDEEEEDEKKAPDTVDEDDLLDSLLAAEADAPKSFLTQRIIAEAYNKQRDSSMAIKSAESGLSLLRLWEQSNGVSLPNVTKAFNVVLATGLVHWFPPKHHVRASLVLAEVLKQEPANIPCLLGSGYVAQYANNWAEAELHFNRVIELVEDGSDLKLEASEEAAWCLVKLGNLDAGGEALQNVISQLDAKEGKEIEKARAWWRLGQSLWDSGGKAKEQAYSTFITSLKRCPTFAPAFTSLGIYYADFVTPSDTARASKCFQKAFELDAREATAARRLAEGFAEEQDWDLVEVIARRTIEGEGGLEGTGASREKLAQARYLPTNSWAWKALGVVELTRRNYGPAIEALQVALRVQTDDFHCWLRLGEAYARSGRHVAALKAFGRAQELEPNDWMLLFLTAEVQRQLGQFQVAIDALQGILNNRPNEVSVLMALAEAHLALGREELATGFLARSSESFAMTMSHAVNAIESSPGFRRVAWKLAFDALVELTKSRTSPCDGDLIVGAVSKVAASISEGIDERIQAIVSPPFLEDSVDTVNRLDMARLAVAVASYRISLGSHDGDVATSAWFDLAVALHHLSTLLVTEERKQPALDLAIDAVKRALRSDPLNALLWNAFGNLHFVSKPKLAQHAFIRATECDASDVVPWTNLGLLYLYHQDFELAHQAFLRSQIIDPDYAMAWVGHGLLASLKDHKTQAKSLFEHAAGLAASVPTADIEFATRSFTIFTSPEASRHPPPSDLLLSPFFSLDRYCKQSTEDPTALHLFGLVCERIGQFDLALDHLTRAISLLEAAYEETEDPVLERRFAIANTSAGRVRLALGDFAGAVESFSITLSLISAENTDEQSKILRANARCGSGLAHFKSEELESALGMFETALEEVPAEMMTVRNHIKVLLAQTLWALGSEEARETAKGQLLECIAADSENLEAITALAAMGMILEDNSLVDAALSEILSLSLEKRQDLDPGRQVGHLLSRYHLEQGKPELAQSVAQREVLVRPLDSRARRDLAIVLLQKGEAKAAEEVLCGTAQDQKSQSDWSTLDQTLRVTAIARLEAAQSSTGASTKGGEDPIQEAKKAGQAAVILAPWDENNWMALQRVRNAISVSG